jgi:hypothetical protein
MMMLSAVALNLTVIGALVKSHQAPAAATTPIIKPKPAVARPALPKVVPTNATSKAIPEAAPKPAAPEPAQAEPEKHTEHEDKVLSDSAAHFIIPVPMPPRVPLPPTARDSASDAATLPPQEAQENIGNVLHAKREDSHAFEENQDGISVKMLLPGAEEVHTKPEEDRPETPDEKEARERKKLRALLTEAEEDLGNDHDDRDAGTSSQVGKNEKKSFKTQSTGSGRLHMKDPNVMAHGSGGGMTSKWGAEVRDKLASWGTEEASRKGTAKFMRMDTTSTASLASFTQQIKEAKALQEAQEEKEEDSSLLEKVEKALPSTVFGFR